MIDFYVTEQSIRFASPVIAANSLDYLTAQFYFAGNTWDGYSKWAHFRQEDTVYDLALEDDRISGDMHLNLSIGQWEVYLTGTKDDSRLTTVPVYITVRESGLIDEPLHQIPLSVAEQVDSKASAALEKVKGIEDEISSGALDGKDFQILGYYGTVEELMQNIQEPDRGDAYGIGEKAPYDIYVYDGIGMVWVNNGSIQGAKGENGEDGATFTPQIDTNGNLSWVNDKGLENPKTMNLVGAKGDKGDKGDDGESPYTLAVKQGFSGTEATFNWSLAHIASHAAQHKAGGTDPLITDTEDIRDGAINRQKLAADVKALCYTNREVKVSDWAADGSYADYGYRAAIECAGATSSCYPQVVFQPEQAMSGELCPVATSYDGGVYIYASAIPDGSITIPTIICSPME